MFNKAQNQATKSQKKPSHDRVRVLFPDHLGLARGKYLPADIAQSGEARFCVGAFAVTYARDLIAATGAGVETGLPDIEAIFDPDDLRASWEDDTRIAMADLTMDGTPSGLCRRNAVKRAVSAWADLGYKPKIGLELEGYIFQKDADGNWVPYDTPGAFVYGTGPFTDPEGLVNEVWAMARKCGLPVESFNSEFDTPQFEMTLRYDDALRASDDVFLFKLMARELMYRKGYLLTFMPKPIAELGGSGMHVNLSLANKKDQNAFARKTPDGPLPDVMKGAVAGLLKHHKALGGILAPTTNSYERLKPASMCGYWANWGYDHRAVAVRISAEHGKGSRIEHRLGDCATSPHIAVAAVLQAAYLGVSTNYSLPKPETGDGFEKVNTDIHVADSLGGAMDNLLADTVLKKAIGEDLVDNYVDIKRAEIKETEGMDVNGQMNYYAPFI